MDYSIFTSPCFILNEARLQKNLEVLIKVKEELHVSIILALKGFAMWSVFPMVKDFLDGATASSLNEALLCYEEMGAKAHTYAPVYRQTEIEKLLRLSSHISFNSLSQYELYGDAIASQPSVSAGLRVNPEYSDVETDLYNPAAPGSRLGVVADQLEEKLPAGIGEGFHFHTLCESDSYSLERTLKAFEDRFGPWLLKLKWVNMGGGHLITSENYDRLHLIGLLKAFQSRYHLEVILEPGAAIAWQTGELKTTVLDIVDNHGIKTAMLDASFTAHMPDTLEMPYRPMVVGAGPAGPEKYNYRLGGMSCLAGDYLEAYGFAKPLSPGDVIIFKDMMHYTMVKTTMFNGVPHPDIAIYKKDGTAEIIRKFEYQDFKRRLS